MSSCFRKHGFQFQPAKVEHDKAIAELLNSNAIPGWVELSYKTTSGFHFSLNRNIKSESVVGIQQSDNEIGGVATRSVHPCFINKQEGYAGWLGQLRIAPQFQKRAHLIRSGFDAVKAFLHDPEKTPYYLASIIAENSNARRILEVNLDGFPIFEPMFNYRVKAFSTQQVRGNISKHIRFCKPHEMPDVIDFINNINRQFNFSPRLKSNNGLDEISAGKWLGLSSEDFLVHSENGGISGVIALWDQQNYRQMQVQGYKKTPPWMRSFLNMISPMTGLPKLPNVGENLKQVFLSLPAIMNGDKEITKELYSAAIKVSKQRGAQLCLAGFTENELQNADSINLKHYNYDSIIYRVYWPEDAYLVNKSYSNRAKIEISLL